MGSFWLMAAGCRDVKAGFFLGVAGRTLLTGMGMEGFSRIPEPSLARRKSKTPSLPSLSPLCRLWSLPCLPARCPTGFPLIGCWHPGSCLVIPSRRTQASTLSLRPPLSAKHPRSSQKPYPSSRQPALEDFGSSLCGPGTGTHPSLTNSSTLLHEHND